MSVRDTDSLAKQLRDIILELNEAKTAQRVGTSQIVVKEYISNSISVTTDTNGFFAEGYAWCLAVAPTISSGNVLITHCVPEVRLNGALIDNAALGAYAYYSNVVDTKTNNTTACQITVIHSSMGGESVPSETFTVRFHIYSAAEVDLTAKEGMYE